MSNAQFCSILAVRPACVSWQLEKCSSKYFLKSFPTLYIWFGWLDMDEEPAPDTCTPSVEAHSSAVNPYILYSLNNVLTEQNLLQNYCIKATAKYKKPQFMPWQRSALCKVVNDWTLNDGWKVGCPISDNFFLFSSQIHLYSIFTII